MTTPKATVASPLNGEEWQLFIQNGKLSRAQINSVIAFARSNYTTDNLPEGSNNLFFTNARANAAVAAALALKADKTELMKPGVPTARTLAFGTAYQATDKTKNNLISVMIESVYTVTLAGTSTDTVELRIGPDAASLISGAGGTAIATFKSSLTGIALTVGMANTQRNQLSALIPPNWYFCVRRVAGSVATITSAFDQPL